jgi:TPR repeat protein
VSAASRSLSPVPPWVAVLLAASLAVQFAWQASRGARGSQSADLPPAPRALLLRAASLGEPEAAARLAMLYLQTYDLRGDNTMPYRDLDYARLIEWLRSIVDTDPRSGYALFSAARVYSENPDAAKCRAMLEFLYEQFGPDPDRRWPWLAHAALVAKHRLKDLPLALRYARAIDRQARDPRAPLWAKQMEIFILEDLDELEAARVMLGGLIASGRITDPTELQSLLARMKRLDQQSAR